MDENHLEDEHDYRIIMQKVLNSAVLDYISMQHSSKRRKSDSCKNFGSANDMLFDDSYRSIKMKTPEGDAMTLYDVAKGAHPTNAVLIDDIRENIRKKAREEWASTDPVIRVPQFITLYGHTYSVVPGPTAVDVDDMLIRHDPESPTAEEDFFSRCLEVVCHHADTRVSRKAIKAMSPVLLELMRMNGYLLPDPPSSS